jgi:hypothetical protein
VAGWSPATGPGATITIRRAFASRNLFDIVIGYDKLFQGDRRKWSARLSKPIEPKPEILVPDTIDSPMSRNSNQICRVRRTHVVNLKTNEQKGAYPKCVVVG